MDHLNEWLDILPTTSDAQRRAHLLNILLIGCLIIGLVAIGGTVIYQTNGVLAPSEAAITYWAVFAFSFTTAVVFLINRYWSSKIAAWLFLFVLTLIIFFADTPYESSWGRNVITMILPVLIAGAILRPTASFVMAGFISVIFYAAAAIESFEPNFLGAMTFLVIALISWLSSRTLERALSDSRSLNQELDHRVVQRTAELQKSNEQLQHEVVERKRSEEIRRQREETLRILLNATTGIALLMDTEGQIQICNEPLSQRMGRPVDEIKGSSVYDLAPPEVSALRRQRVAEVIASGQPRSYEETYGETTVENFVHPIADDNGRVVLLAIFAQNVTERKRAETNLRQALEQEKELNRLKSRFISMASHEFRTPLTTILSSVGLLEHANGTMLPERRLRHYDKVRTAVNHMNGLLEDVLLIGKAENGRMEFRPEPLDIKQLCLDITEEMQLAVRETHHIRFTAQFAPEQLLLDSSLIRQILTNLLSNAIKYSPHGGDIIFSLVREAGSLVLSVCDQGIGIPESDQARLFEAFHRAGNVSTISGTGLGLAIVREAVTLHGGTIYFTSEEGAGTEFVVKLPLIEVTPS